MEPSTTHEDTTLGTDSTVPRHVVHKQAVDQVFVTDYMKGPGDTLATVSARLPLAHARFSDTAAPFHDIVLIAETVRQAGIIVAEEVMGVPAGRQFLLRELRVDLDPLEHNQRSRETCELTMTTDPASRVKMRPNRTLVGGLMRVNCSIAGRPSGMCEVIGAWVPDEVYASMRGGREADSAQGLPGPARHDEREPMTGKLNPNNSILTPLRRGAEPREWSAVPVVDRDDPTFFDHPLDHIPGLLMLEALQQVSVAATCHELGVEPERVVVSSFDIKFSRLAEFMPDATCTARVDEDGAGADVSVSQLDKACCSGRVGIAVL